MLTPRLKSLLDTVEGLAVIVAASAVVFTLATGRVASTAGRSNAPRVPQIEDVRAQHLAISVNRASTLGHDDARIAVVEFSDFQCPFCGQYAKDTFPKLRANFVDAAKVSFVFKHFPLQIHAFATEAAKHATCAGQQSSFWPMHDRLFDGQARLSQPFLMTGPAELHLDRVKFAKCLETAEEVVNSDIAEARRLGVTSTPTFFLGTVTKTGSVSVSTRIAGAYPYETFASAITALMSRKLSG
jgi:protein-disulfide isomerase